MLQNTVYLNLAGIFFKLKFSFLVETDNKYSRFELADSPACNVTINFNKTGVIKLDEGEKVIERSPITVTYDGRYFRRYFLSSGRESDGLAHGELYMCQTTEAGSNLAEVDILDKSTVGKGFYWRCLMPEHFLMRYGTVILHSSFVEYGGKAILFSGRSGVGKSTQAELWLKSFGGEIINGDRTAIKAENGKIYAMGIPFCGTSGINKTGKFEVASINFLEQSPECGLIPLDKSTSFKNIIKNIAVNTWDGADVMNAVDIAQTIAASVPVNLLKCDRSEKGVGLVRDSINQ